MNNVLYFIRSSFHVDLIEQNREADELTHLVNLNDNLTIAPSLTCKENVKIYNFFEAHSIVHTKSVYVKLYDIYMACDFNKVVVFNNYFPYSRHCIDFFTEKKTIVEMWEDGLNHYLNLHHNKLFYLKGLMKLILGHYSKGVFDPDYKRYKLNIRDRFVNKNLVYKPTVFTDVKDVHGVIFIAQPVVDDGIITIDKYISGLCRLAKHYESYPFYYLTHPREKNKVIDTLVSNGFKVIEVNESAECYLMRNRYTINISMFSTVICNIFEYRNCKYVPEFFYLEKLNNLIKNSVFNKKD